MPEQIYLAGGFAGYTAGAVLAWGGYLRRRSTEPWVLLSLGLAVALFAYVIAQRWISLGHGPFLNMFEILLSNVFSLGLVYCLFYWRSSLVRPSALVALPILLLLSAWLLTVSAEPSQLPATYDNPWLWVHVGVGKLFLGVCLVGVGLAGLLLLAASVPGAAWAQRVPDTETLDALAWRCMALAFVFESLMLIAGAVWAQDAWGRYWAWDPLETWAFLTWLLLGLSLHLRVTFRLPRALGWGLIVAVFVLAVLTFLGVPFVSMAPHKGVL